MIEVESRFALKSIPAPLAKLAPLKEKSQLDVYYDTPDYALLRQGGFLRVRNNKRMDFKGDFSFAAEVHHDYCNETNFDLNNIPQKSGEINKLLRLFKIEAAKTYKNIDDFLKQNNLRVLATIEKTRREYKFGDMTIALDDTENIGLFLEVEVMVPDDTSKEKILALKNKMHTELAAYGLLPPDAQQSKIGYVELYLQRHNPAAYKLGLYK